MNKMNSILLILSLALSVSAHSQDSFFTNIQTEIESLLDGESFDIKYAKSGDWGAYEGGTMIYTLVNDTIHIKLTNKQNYLDAQKKTTTAVYPKMELLETLEENKRSYYKDPDNTVFNNSFYYQINKDGEEVAKGSSPLEPSDVVNMINLSDRIQNIFDQRRKNKLIINHAAPPPKKN